MTEPVVWEKNRAGGWCTLVWPHLTQKRSDFFFPHCESSLSVCFSLWRTLVRHQITGLNFAQKGQVQLGFVVITRLRDKQVRTVSPQTRMWKQSWRSEVDVWTGKSEANGNHPTYSGWLSRLKWEKLSLTLGFFLTLFHIREKLSQNPLHSQRRIPAKRAGVPWGEKGGRQRKRRKSNRVCSISFKINQLVILFEMRPKRVSFLSLHGHPGVMLMPVGVRWSGPGDFRTGAWGQTWVYFPGQACVQKHPQQCPRCPPGANQTETVSGAKRTAGRWTAHFI